MRRDLLPILLTVGGVVFCGMVAVGAAGVWFLTRTKEETKRTTAETPRRPAPASPPVEDAKKVFNGPPRADREGVEWGLEDLGKYLKEQGVITQWEVTSDRHPLQDHRPYLLVKPTDGKALEMVRIDMEDGPISAEKKVTSRMFATDSNDVKRYITESYATWGKFIADSKVSYGKAHLHAFSVLPGSKEWRFKEKPVEINLPSDR